MDIQSVNVARDVIERLSHWHNSSSICLNRAHVPVQGCDARGMFPHFGYVSIDRFYACGIFFDCARKSEVVLLKG